MNSALSIFFLVCSIVLTKVFCRMAQGTRLMDKPNNRSMHSKPTVRGGGLIFIGLSLISIPVLCYLTQTPFHEQVIFMLSIFMIAAVSFGDDLFNLSVKPRFLVQCVAAGLVAWFMKPEQLDFGFFTMSYSLLIIPLVFFFVLWSINHFNFMDGLDGFCASQALFLCASYALLFALHGASFYQGFCLVLAAGLVGFLMFNFPPAKLFMGDVGSATLGLISFCIALIGQQKFQIPILFWFMLNCLFLFDATLTLIRRMIRKEKWSAPHRKHAYQRLRQSGITVPVILLGQLVLNSTFFILVILLNMDIFMPFYVILLQVGLVVLVYCLIEKIFPMFCSEFSS
ncbi:MraY family glycosyltransferase [Legionella saoudiensis]|uniref:MraY family glycosyltransferase n=1 Tax=Legionella saoudiensis TaxID=1750561 RepID=UPI00122E4885|nr:glycosyltransferase family 4 protein [Legionella saoudiensis]